MKKLIFAILLFLSVFADSYSQQSIRIGAGNIYYIGGDSNYFRFNKQGFFSFGLKTIGTSYMHGQLQFPNADGILLTGGNVTLNDGGNINVNGGGYFLDGVNITTLFPSLSGRNTWTKWNKFDTLGVGSSAYFTFGSSTVALNNAGFYVGTLGSSDLTVSHELNVTGASITGFNAVKISVDTITAPDEIVNIYGGLNVLAGGYPIFGRTENQNVTFSRHNTSGDLIGLQLTSTGTNLTYFDSVASTTTTLSLNKNVAKLNSDTIATQSYVRSNGGTGSSDTNQYVKKYGAFEKKGDLTISQGRLITDTLFNDVNGVVFNTGTTKKWRITTEGTLTNNRDLTNADVPLVIDGAVEFYKQTGVGSYVGGRIYIDTINGVEALYIEKNFFPAGFGDYNLGAQYNLWKNGYFRDTVKMRQLVLTDKNQAYTINDNKVIQYDGARVNVNSSFQADTLIGNKLKVDGSLINFSNYAQTSQVDTLPKLNASLNIFTKKMVVGTGTSNGTADFLVMGDTTTLRGTVYRDSSFFRVMVNPFSQRMKVEVLGKTGNNMLTVDSTLISSALAMSIVGDFNSLGNIKVGSNNKSISWLSRSVMYSYADGNITLMNNAETSFGILQLGGTTSSFPSIKRSGTGIQIRLADDSGYGALTAASFTTDTPTGGTAGTWKLGIYKTDGSSLVVSSTNYIQVDIGGTLYKLAVVN